MAGELVGESVRGWLSGVVAGEEGLDGDLLVALGGIAWPGLGQGASDGGHGDGDERLGGVLAVLGHTTAAFTVDVYAVVAEELAESVAAAIEAYVPRKGRTGATQ